MLAFSGRLGRRRRLTGREARRLFRTSRRPVAAPRLPADCWIRPPKRRAHHVLEVAGGEAGAAEQQLGDETSEKDAALLYR